MNIKDALKSHFVKALLRDTVGDDYDVIKRPAACSFRSKDEAARDINRLILLPPHGYTADSISQMNSHDEVERATIEIKGGIRQGKNGFSKLKDCLLFAAHNDKRDVSTLNKPYVTYSIDSNDDSNLVTALHSAGQPPFSVVKSNGYGFYHNLVNTSNDWLMLKLHKRTRPMKEVDLRPHLNRISKPNAEILKQFYQGIVLYGDAVFTKMPNVVNALIKMPTKQALPALGEMLYAYETGRHEACTAFAMILQLSKKDPEIVSNFLHNTLAAETIPSYYANQLVYKIENTQDHRLNSERLAAG